MKAIVYERDGPPEVLHPTDVAAPVPGRHDVVHRVRATIVSKADIRCRIFDVPCSFWIPARLKLGIFGPRRTIPGGEFAGDVAEVGADVVRFKPDTSSDTIGDSRHTRASTGPMAAPNEPNPPVAKASRSPLPGSLDPRAR